MSKIKVSTSTLNLMKRKAHSASKTTRKATQKLVAKKRPGKITTKTTATKTKDIASATENTENNQVKIDEVEITTQNTVTKNTDKNTDKNTQNNIDKIATKNTDKTLDTKTARTRPYSELARDNKDTDKNLDTKTIKDENKRSRKRRAARRKPTNVRQLLRKILFAAACFILGAASVILVSIVSPFFQLQSSPKPVYERIETTNPDDIASKIINHPSSAPAYGDVFGRVDIDSQNIHLDLTLGSDLDNLKTGTAMYSGSVFPGEKGVSLIAGHARLDQLGRMTYMKPGETITVTTAWGQYVYRIDNMTVENVDKYPIDDKLADKSGYKAIFYTCYPIDKIGPTDRMFVETTLISGPVFADSLNLPSN